MASRKMLLMFVLATVQSATGARMSSAEGLSTMFAQRLRSHEGSLEKLHKHLSVDAAFEYFQRKNSSAFSSLLELKKMHRPKKLRHRKARHHLAHIEMHHAAASSPSGYAGVEGATKMLNDMVYKVKEKYETELEKCCEYDASQSELMETTRQAIASCNAKAAEGRKEMLSAGAQVSTCREQIPALGESLKKLNAQCTQELATLDGMIDTVESDVKVMEEVLKAAKCDSDIKDDTLPSLLMLTCTDDCGEYKTFRHSNSKTTQFLAENSRAQVLATRLFSNDKSGSHEDSADSDADSDADDDTEDATTTGSGEVDPSMTSTSPEPRVLRRARPCKEPTPVSKRAGKCTIRDSPDCKKLNEKFFAIQTGILENAHELKVKRAALAEDCEGSKENFEAQIRSYEQKLKDYSTALAGATAQNGEAVEESRLKTIELSGFKKNYAEMTTQCHKNYAELESEQCALEKIRGEVFNKLKGNRDAAFFQDCVVSEWTPELPGCSKTCGGGFVKMVRAIETHPVGGSECPALEMYKNCNEQNCPIDCRLGDWSGYSGCSAECGGGVMERQRMVEVEPQYDGEACGEVSEVESCNPQSCDKDCELSDWTAWSNCSKMCNGGKAKRVRNVLEPQVGGGTCPDVNGNVRLQEQTCNTDPCYVEKGQLLECVSAIDLVLVIDGSGSIGQAGWDESIKVAKHIVQSVKPSEQGSQISLIVYSAPNAWCEYYMCMGYQPAFEYCGTPSEPLKCGVDIIQHFTGDETQLLGALDGATWPGYTTFTSYALHAAKSELKLGRPDVQSNVVLITDGVPNDPLGTADAAEELKKSARLIIVPVSAYAPLENIKKWASDDDDVVSVEHFEALDDPAVINGIISTSCAEVRGGDINLETSR